MQTSLDLTFIDGIEHYNDIFEKNGFNAQIAHTKDGMEILETNTGVKLGEFFGNSFAFMPVITNSSLNSKFLRILADYIDKRNQKQEKGADK